MARKLEFYQGRRQKRNFWLIPFIILLGVITLMFVLFYGVQKYAVISDDGVSVVFPGTKAESGSTVGHRASSGLTFDTVVPEIVFEAPDYSRITATAGKRVWSLRAKYLDASQISLETLQNAAASLVDGNALMLEMKPRSGQLVWNSQTDMARNFGTSTDTEFSNSLPTFLPTLKEREDGKKIYLVAQISCFIDDLLATRSDQFALRTESGFNYSNEDGSWLDPYNSDVRNYIIGLAKELYAMGFDEVVLSDVRHPVGAEVQNAEGEYVKASFTYSREMSTEPNPITAICGFAVYAADQLKERNGLLSIYTDTPRSLVRDDEDNGQNAVLFMKIFDRVYYRTDRYTYTYNLQDMEGSVPYGRIQDRFVPVVINLIPHDNSSWVYIEQLE
ncbi:MAG: putative glycoside hydrolase [Oscillospiraceae bacterium]|nr:putative glycoside hydrolase [Oscillospiraceae bacterium]